MSESIRILIADDEKTFLLSTAALLRREGYECDCVEDADAALEKLGQEDYDLLIADIKMPGNAELELIQAVSRIAKGLPVILVTGYPSMNSAIQSINLPVIAYLLKPIDFEELLAKVRLSTQHSEIVKKIKSLRKLFQRCSDDLKEIEETQLSRSEFGSPAQIDHFVTLTYQNIFKILKDLTNLTGMAGLMGINKEICQVLNCSHLKELKDALSETIEVIEETKSLFKSKPLGDLRKKLEILIKEI